MSEEMNNELEEVIIVTATDDQGNEVEYQEVQRLDLDGRRRRRLRRTDGRRVRRSQCKIR